MRTTPVLILAYNRPEKVRRLIDRLRPQAPQRLMISVDGPKPGDAMDAAKVAAVHEALQAIDWTDDVETRLRPVNLGLRLAVADAVTWAVETHGEAVILEEDVLPGDQFLPYMTHMLERFRDDEMIAHVSGYNIVPPERLAAGGTSSRLTIYPESIAWGTWSRAWAHFDDSLEWGANVSIAELSSVTGDRISALRWKQSFRDAAAGRISTWAYRWIASMWSRRALTVSPNQNLVTYAGYDEGTNSVLKAPWEELPLFEAEISGLVVGDVVRDLVADSWVNRNVSGGTISGVTRGLAVSGLLEARKLSRRMRTRA